MTTLEDIVRAVVQDLMDQDELFTALDVSNRVKKQLPYARHREVREVVRGLFTTDIETKGWTRSPITVTLDDGSTAEALLYHPLSDTWDLDSKYDVQRRKATSLNPAQTATTAVAATATPAPVVFSTPTTSTPTATVTVAATAKVPMQTARDLWKQLFDTQPSLFPTK